MRALFSMHRWGGSVSSQPEQASDGAAGCLLLVSAPSGAGKTTLVKRLVAEDDGVLLSVSHTTRARRGNERDGVEYNFVDEDTFEAMVRRDEFLEHANVFGRRYGTSRRWVEERLATGRDVLLEIDWQGAAQVRQRVPEAVSIFILPPSREELLARLRGRGEDAASDIQRRTAEAQVEMAHWGEFDYVIVNEQLDVACADLRAVVLAERLRRARQALRQRERIADLLADGPGAPQAKE